MPICALKDCQRGQQDKAESNSKEPAALPAGIFSTSDPENAYRVETATT
jgi:hypothetical protein